MRLFSTSALILVVTCSHAISRDHGIRKMSFTRTQGTGRIQVSWEIPTAHTPLATLVRADLEKSIRRIERQGLKNISTSLIDKDHPGYGVTVKLGLTYHSDSLISEGGTDYDWPGSASLSSTTAVTKNWGVIDGKPSVLSLLDVVRKDRHSVDALKAKLSMELQTILAPKHASQYANRAPTDLRRRDWGVSPEGLIWYVSDPDRAHWVDSVILTWATVGSLLDPQGPLGAHAAH